MPYSALIFETKQTSENVSTLEHALQIFQDDVHCSQIVISCQEEWLLKLISKPGLKTTYVPMAKSPYVALLNGLKAVTQENVLVVGLSKEHSQDDIQEILDILNTYPTVYKDEDLQAFDTRLLMFCLQRAIETNIEIKNYADAIEKLSDLPIQYI